MITKIYVLLNFSYKNENYLFQTEYYSHILHSFPLVMLISFVNLFYITFRVLTLAPLPPTSILSSKKWYVCRNGNLSPWQDTAETGSPPGFLTVCPLLSDGLWRIGEFGTDCNDHLKGQNEMCGGSNWFYFQESSS